MRRLAYNSGYGSTVNAIRNPNQHGASRMVCRIIPSYPKSRKEPKIIFATNGMEVLVDAEDYVLLSRHNWYINWSAKRPYAITKLKTDQSTIWRCIFMHHLILGTAVQTDHRDGNSLNNQKHNLRPATREENEWNKGKNATARGKPCSSKYKGVARHGKKWSAKIKRNGVLYNLGEFEKEEDAAKAYNKKAAELSGEFLWKNKIPNYERIEGQKP